MSKPKEDEVAKPTLTKRDQVALQKYVRELADRMELKDWRITVERDPPSVEIAVSTCGTVFGQKTAYIRVDYSFRTIEKWVQRETMVHELLHCFDSAETELTCGMRNVMKKQAYEQFKFAVCQENEFRVDAISRIIAPKMPLIQWPES